MPGLVGRRGHTTLATNATKSNILADPYCSSTSVLGYLTQQVHRMRERVGGKACAHLAVRILPAGARVRLIELVRDEKVFIFKERKSF